MKSQILTVPTETVEGYAVKLGDEAGIRALMRLKDRDFNSDKVFTLAPESKEAIKSYALISPLAARLIDKYFPGELTLILPKNPAFRHFYYDHYKTIGLRLPNYAPFLENLAASGPLILTSANPRGGTPKSLTGHLPSTILDLTGKTPKILSQGNLILTKEDVCDIMEV